MFAGLVIQRQATCACGGDCPRCQTNKADPPHHHGDQLSSNVFETLRSPGKPLDLATRQFMGEKFAHDFSRVRVHDDAAAAASAQAVDALAYTVGHDVVFGSGYVPGTKEGKRLLAHELTHVVQQSRFGTAVQSELALGSTQDQAEVEAAQMAQWVMADRPSGPAPGIKSQATAPTLRRQEAPQRRGEVSRHVRLPQPARGEDQVSIIIFRYLCNCMGRDVSRSSVSTRTQPRLGVVYEFCRGRTTLRITGEVAPSSLTTGSVTATVDVNIAPEQGGAGGRVQVQGVGRNTGTEPQVGGSVRGTVQLPGGGPDLSAGGSIFRGTQTGQIDTTVGTGVRVGDVTIGVEGTNLQDARRAGLITLGGNLPGPNVQRQICRECSCPVVYDCYEDIAPREEPDPPNIEVDTSRLRYYFRLDRSEDATSPALRRESTQMLDRLATLVADGYSIVSITGYASPEAAEREHNEPLSLTRGQRLRELVAARLGAEVSLPEPERGQELLGSVPTIAPGSRLADAIFAEGFSGPEEVSQLLVGGEIENDQLANQFLGLFNRITEPNDRLRLFGLTPESPIGPQLLLAINRFVAGRGRGPRPWERTFEFLRFAAVQVRRTREVASTTSHYTRGSYTQLGNSACNQHARDAEARGLFPKPEAEPTSENCSTGQPRNLPDYADRCDYDQ
jgi:uncharacterized protein DUF4157